MEEPLPAETARYSRYYSLLESFFTSKEKVVVDVGCSKGGFLAYLKEKGCNNLIALSSILICAEYARKNHGLQILSGSANTIPLPDRRSTFSFIVTFWSILKYLCQILKEMHRVLKDDGIVFIEIPNAVHYTDAKMFDFFYWFRNAGTHQSFRRRTSYNVHG